MNLNHILTPCVVKTTIICTAVLLVLLCIASLIKNLYGAKDNCNNCHKRKHLSYKYVVGILIFLLVILFSHKFYKYDNIFNFLSFASAIISIILAVLTIIYSYFTNGTTSSSVEKMGEASKKIEGTLLKVNEATQSYKESADSLKNNITTLLNTIQHVDQTTNKLLEAQGLNNKPNTKALEDAISSDKVTDFVALSSNVGNVLMYACIKACDNKKNFVLGSIWEEKDVEYCVGFLIAAKSAGLFNLRIWSDRSRGIEVGEYNPALKSAIEKHFAERNIGYYKEMLPKIDALFNNR